jgi:hypothetical protein
VIDPITPECQMSKRKPSKRSDSPKIPAKAQRAAQAVVRSPSYSSLRSLGAGSAESSPKHNDPRQLVENPVTALQAETPPKDNDPKQEALLVGNLATALQDECKQTIADNASKTAVDFSSAAANVQAYQAKLLEMAQANMQFTFEFAQRLATIRSPLEFLSVIAEFATKRIAMFGKYSKELTEISIMR